MRKVFQSNHPIPPDTGSPIHDCRMNWIHADNLHSVFSIRANDIGKLWGSGVNQLKGKIEKLNKNQKNNKSITIF